MVRCYQWQLHSLSLTALVSDSCWALLEAVVGCTELLRCRLHSEAHKWIAAGRPDVSAMLAALHPHPSPPPLRPLPHLHTLSLELPLSAAELQRCLHAAPALNDLVVGRIHSLDALHSPQRSARQSWSALPLHLLRAAADGCIARASTDGSVFQPHLSRSRRLPLLPPRWPPVGQRRRCRCSSSCYATRLCSTSTR